MKKCIFLLAALLLVAFVSCYCPIAKKAVEAEAVVEFQDYGPNPFVFDLEAYTLENDLFRQAIWTGTYMQMTVMSIAPGGEIGLEKHGDIDQFIRVEEGTGIILMGDDPDNLDIEEPLEDDFAAFIPAGKWHNVINTGDKPLKLYSIYAKPEHPFGTVHKTYEEAMEAEHDHDH
ncbi:MAG: cupin domain-containing protein [Bacteroidales bacterium]